jgi:putative alpha-1,2-mannosidase
MAGTDIGAWYSFDVEAGEAIEVKVGVSYVSIENARENLKAEQAGLRPGESCSGGFPSMERKTFCH